MSHNSILCALTAYQLGCVREYVTQYPDYCSFVSAGVNSSLTSQSPCTIRSMFLLCFEFITSPLSLFVCCIISFFLFITKCLSGPCSTATCTSPSPTYHVEALIKFSFPVYFLLSVVFNSWPQRISIALNPLCSQML